MSETIDFNAELEKRNGPDKDCVYVGGLGYKWFKYSAHYNFNDKEYGFTFWALKGEEQQVLDALKQTSRVMGQIYQEGGE